MVGGITRRGVDQDAVTFCHKLGLLALAPCRVVLLLYVAARSALAFNVGLQSC